jgi:hypothetical protein
MATFDRRKNNWQHDLRHSRADCSAAESCGRSPKRSADCHQQDPSGVCIKRLIEFGAADIGENRVQEAEEKIPRMGATQRAGTSSDTFRPIKRGVP